MSRSQEAVDLCFFGIPPLPPHLPPPAYSGTLPLPATKSEKKIPCGKKNNQIFTGAVLKLPFHCCNSLAQFLLSLLVLLLLYPVFSKHKRLDRIEEFALKKQVFLTAANLLGKVSSMKL